MYFFVENLNYFVTGRDASSHPVGRFRKQQSETRFYRIGDLFRERETGCGKRFVLRHDAVGDIKSVILLRKIDKVARDDARLVFFRGVPDRVVETGEQRDDGIRVVVREQREIDLSAALAAFREHGAAAGVRILQIGRRLAFEREYFVVIEIHVLYALSAEREKHHRSHAHAFRNAILIRKSWVFVLDDLSRLFNGVFYNVGKENDMSFPRGQRLPLVRNHAELHVHEILRPFPAHKLENLEQLTEMKVLLCSDHIQALIELIRVRADTYKFDKCLYVVATQQNLHFRQLFKVLELMGREWAKDLVHVQFGMVSYEGQPLSTRKGHVVFLADVIENTVEKARKIIEDKNPGLPDKDRVAESVGVGAVMFFALGTQRIKDVDFDYDKVLSFEGETAPYLQYTHARCRSVLSKGGERGREIDFSLLTDDDAYAVVTLLSRFNDTVRDAAEKYEPSVIARYLIDLAQKYNRFYIADRIVTEDKALSAARLALTEKVADTIKTGLGLLLTEAPDRM